MHDAFPDVLPNSLAENTNQFVLVVQTHGLGTNTFIHKKKEKIPKN
jgi:hypothetical protein